MNLSTFCKELQGLQRWKARTRSGCYVSRKKKHQFCWIPFCVQTVSQDVTMERLISRTPIGSRIKSIKRLPSIPPVVQSPTCGF